MKIKCLAQGHYCRCQQIRTGDLTIESPWSYPLSHNSSRATWLWRCAHYVLAGNDIMTSTVYQEQITVVKWTHRSYKNWRIHHQSSMIFSNGMKSLCEGGYLKCCIHVYLVNGYIIFARYHKLGNFKHIFTIRNTLSIMNSWGIGD